MLAPSDDPVASARALEVTQAQDITKQYEFAQSNAGEALSIVETQLQSASELLSQVRTLAVQAGNSALTHADRMSIVTQLRAGFDQMLGIANSTDGSGQYLFSGYMGNTKPFGGNVANGVSYYGDDGQRRLQVSASRQMEVSESGNSVFNRVTTGNGTFSTDFNPANAGTAIIDNGTVTDPAKWASASNSGNLQVKFWVDTTGAVGPANTTYYDLVDATTNNSLFTATASITGAGGTFTHAYTSGQQIDFSGLAAPYNDFGVTVSITGAPASGDSFTLQNSASQSVFDTLRDIISAVETPQASGSNDSIDLANKLGFALANIDQAAQNILTAQTGIGSRLNEIDALKSVNSSLSLQYQQTLSQLQDVDYTKAISDMSRLQVQLEAAQKSFVNVSQLSLFNYIT